ncbi:hypothetical protein ACOMHN_037587 [Nucella lapillus]
MALDTDKGCSVCGILNLSGPEYKKGKAELCRACKCAEDTAAQTPCGHCYCQQCGILIDLIGQNRHTPQYCTACTQLLNSVDQSGDFSKASKPCQCEFCSNHYNMSPPTRKFMKMSVEPTGRKVVPGGNYDVSMSAEPEDSSQKGPREKLVEEELRDKWEREQLSLKKKLVTQDSSSVKKMLEAISSKDSSKKFYIGGVDISFIKDNKVDACAALIIISFPDLQVVYKRLEMIQLTAPYIPGFLAFREVEFLMGLYNTMLENAPQYKPHVIFVDGNGRLHPRGFGLACHLGVLLDVPCVGVAKTLIRADGIEDNAAHKAKKQGLKNEGDTFPLITDSGETLGMALRGTSASANPIYVSVGHKVSPQSAVTLVLHCCKYRIPEPTRFADLYSRQYLMDKKQDPEELIVQQGERSPNEWQ